MISRKTKYGLNALMYLSKEYKKDSVLIATLAEKERIPKKFLETILLELKNKGILHSKKGKGGGYSLARDPREIMVGQVLRILGGPLAPVACVSQSAYHKCEECHDEKTCGVRLVMKEVRDAMSNILDKTSLNDLLDKVKHATNKSAFDFII